MIYILFFLVIPLIGALWYLNVITFMKRLNNGKNTQNQTVLGLALTFIFILSFMYGLISLH
jgi:hypothetical protein